jgi:hypothetical protein
MADDVVRHDQRPGRRPDVVREHEVVPDGVVADPQAGRAERARLRRHAGDDQVVRDRVPGLAADHMAAKAGEPEAEVHAAVRDAQVVADVQVAHAVEDERLVRGPGDRHVMAHIDGPARRVRPVPPRLHGLRCGADEVVPDRRALHVRACTVREHVVVTDLDAAEVGSPVTAAQAEVPADRRVEDAGAGVLPAEHVAPDRHL